MGKERVEQKGERLNREAAQVGMGLYDGVVARRFRAIERQGVDPGARHHYHYRFHYGGSI